MTTLYTTAQAAAMLKSTPRTIRRWAVTLGLGQEITPRLRLLTAADIAAIKKHVKPEPGNPQFGVTIKPGRKKKPPVSQGK